MARARSPWRVPELDLRRIAGVHGIGVSLLEGGVEAVDQLAVGFGGHGMAA
jgi:hypothetical protein